MQEYYKILGVSENASIEEIDLAYSRLKAKYSEERFSLGEKGNIAARNLTKLETAYYEVINARKSTKYEGENRIEDFSEVQVCIKKGDLNGAQAKLDDISERSAEWHYLQSVVFYKKNWTNESKKQLEIAISMEPHNTKYSESYTKLKQKIEFNDRQYQSGNPNYAGASGDPNQRQMGGNGSNDCLSFCATWCCMNLLCNMCCH